MDEIQDEATVRVPEIHQAPTPPSDSMLSGSAETRVGDQEHLKDMDVDDDRALPEMLSPLSTLDDKAERHELPVLPSTELSSPSMGYEFSNVRVCTPTDQYQKIEC